jgi:hypothetical protein
MSINDYLEGVGYDPALRSLTKDRGKTCIANIRGWATIEKAFGDSSAGADFQDSVGRFFAEAIREKLASDFGNPNAGESVE